MKSFSIVLMSAVFYALFSGSAHAESVANSVHNFEGLGGGPPCGYCHTVHNSLGGSGLMNPGFGGFPTITKVYSSATRVHKSTKAIVDVSDAPLCLACHDKTAVEKNPNLTIVLDRIVNRPSINIGGTETDLSNDHPVGFVFDPSLSPATIKAPVKAHVTFGPSRNQMWCSSCHNVHNNQYGMFLVMSNAGSALCLDCHIK